MEAVISAISRKLHMMDEQADTILERIHGPQIEKSDQWQTPMMPGLLATLNEYDTQLERIVGKLWKVLDTI